METLAIPSSKYPEGGFTQACRLFEHRVEYRRKDSGRAVDDPQYLRRRGLLLQCLPRIGHQMRVLHRDDRLRRKVLQQCDCFFGEWPYFLAVDEKGAEEHVVPTQRHPERGSGASLDGQHSPCLIARPINFIVRDVCDGHDGFTSDPRVNSPPMGYAEPL